MTLIRDNEGQYIMIKGSIQGEDRTILNIYIYIPNTGEPNYIKQILANIKGEIDSNTIRVGDVNTRFASMGRSQREN